MSHQSSVLAELPWGLPHEQPTAAVALVRQALHHLPRASAPSRLYVHLLSPPHTTALQTDALETALVGYYAVAMSIEEEGESGGFGPEVIVLPPTTTKAQGEKDEREREGYEPCRDLPDVGVLFTLAPVPDQEQARLNAARDGKGHARLTFAVATPVPGVAMTTMATTSVMTKDFPTYGETALGGTFDRLHAGHKVMLTIAALSTERRLLMGVTGDEMLKNKKHGDVMQPYDLRASNAVTFLNAIDPHLTYDAIEINDPYGPTITDPAFEAIIVSEETRKGAVDINEKRQAKGLRPLETIVVKLVDAPPSLGVGKLSSTALREQFKKHTPSSS